MIKMKGLGRGLDALLSGNDKAQGDEQRNLPVDRLKPGKYQPRTHMDALCLQELKLEDHNFPRAEIEAAGYHVAFSGQKTYNGVALLATSPISDVVCGNPLFPDEQKRLISGTVAGVRVISAYMPNGQEVGCDKYDYKLRWLDALAQWLESAQTRWYQPDAPGDPDHGRWQPICDRHPGK